MRRLLVVLLLLPAAAQTARGDSQPESFAHFFGIQVGDVKEVAGYVTPPGVEVTHILLGRWYEVATRQLVPGLVLMRCNEKECRGGRVWLHPLDAEIDILGLVDLRAPGALGERYGIERARPGAWVEIDHYVRPARRYAWPALMIALRERRPMTTGSRFGGDVSGTHRHTELLVISLRAADERSPELLSTPTEDIYPTGAGAITSYRLARGGNQDALDVIATEQREIESRSLCLRPAPTEYRFVLERGRYQRRRSEAWSPPGCH